MDKCSKTAALYVASLKALSLIHQHSHWTTKGNDFYGDHLLFERIYKSALDNLDLAAEKFIGLFGAECLDYQFQAELLNKVLLKYKGLNGEPLEMSLAVEKDFLKLSKDAYNCFEDEGKLTLGLDDMVMAIASDREGAVYLLRQPLKKAAIRKSAVPTGSPPVPQIDPIQEYLMRAIPLAAASAGINNVIVSKVEVHKGATTGSGAVMDNTYTAYVSGIPPQAGESFKKAWDKQLATQKPDLVGRVGFFLQ